MIEFYIWIYQFLNICTEKLWPTILYFIYKLFIWWFESVCSAKQLSTTNPDCQTNELSEYKSAPNQPHTSHLIYNEIQQMKCCLIHVIVLSTSESQQNILLNHWNNTFNSEAFHVHCILITYLNNRLLFMGLLLIWFLVIFCHAPGIFHGPSCPFVSHSSVKYSQHGAVSIGLPTARERRNHSNHGTITDALWEWTPLLPSYNNCIQNCCSES